MKRIKQWTARICSPDRERAASLVEYALVIALIAAVCIAAVTTFGDNTDESMRTSADAVSGSTTTPTPSCASVHADGYSTSPGDPHGNCYSPSHGYYTI
ncbi:MAG TPA: Flp family type IVb pilin [Acidimicrobiales bacterium]|nr:Flp family type IVb pilin [Acidimicrobiales bacterium]